MERQLRAVVYSRVSTDAQERDGTSLDTQERASQEYVADDGSLGEAGSAGSTWMVVVYVVIGLVAVALFGLLGRRLLRVRSTN
jgi:hypothetical protein